MRPFFTILSWLLLLCCFVQAQEESPEFAFEYQGREILLTLDEATTYFGRIIDNKPTAAAYRYLGLVHLLRDEFDLAIADLTEAIRSDGRKESLDLLILAYEARGRNSYIKNELESAIADFSQAIALGSKEVFVARGSAYRDMGRFDEAIQDYSLAIRQTEEVALPYILRGQTWAVIQSHDLAIRDFSAAIRIDAKDANTYVSRGNAWIAKENWDKAIADFDAALSVNPKCVLAYTGRGKAHQKQGHGDKATADYMKAVSIDSTSSSALSALARFLVVDDPKQQNLDRALQLAEQACQLEEWRDSAALNTLSWVCFKRGAFEDAVKFQEQAVEHALPSTRLAQQKLLYEYKRIITLPLLHLKLQ